MAVLKSVGETEPKSDTTNNLLFNMPYFKIMPFILLQCPSQEIPDKHANTQSSQGLLHIFLIIIRTLFFPHMRVQPVTSLTPKQRVV